MNIGDFLTEKFVWLKAPVQTPLEIFEEVNKKCMDHGFINETFLGKIIERESLFPTGLQMDGYGVAIPHTDPECINKQFIAVIIPEEEVSFNRMDDVNASVNVKLVFVLGLNQPHSQLAVLQELMLLLQNKDIVENIKNTVDKKYLINYLTELSKQKQIWKEEK